MAKGGRPTKRSLGSEEVAAPPVHLCARSGFLPKSQRGQSNFRKSGVIQGPTSSAYQSLKNEEERASLVFVELPSVIPRVPGLCGKYTVVWQGMRLCEGNLNQKLYFSVCRSKCNYFIRNWSGISTQVSLSFWLPARSHMLPVKLFSNIRMWTDLTHQQRGNRNPFLRNWKWILYGWR